MTEEEKGKGFRIVDKRTSSQETPEAKQPEQPEEEKPGAETGANQANTDGQGATTAQQDQAAPITFAAYLQMMSMQGFVALGLLADPQTKQARKDLAQARSIIDLLDMLKDKTKGNLSAEEDRLLKDMLYNLRMNYVKNK